MPLQDYLKNKKLVLIGASLAVLSLAVWFYFALFKTQKEEKLNPEFEKYVEAYTSGMVSKSSNIYIRFAADVKTVHTKNEPVSKDLFSFSPVVEGNAYWIDDRTIEFKPTKKLETGEFYNASFQLGELIDVPDDLKEFPFQFQVIKPSFFYEQYGLRAQNNSSLSLMTLKGSIEFSDTEDPKAIEKILTATQPDSKLSIKWQHIAAEHLSYFTIENIKRTKTESTLQLQFSGESINASNKDKTQTIKVPAKGDFKVLDVVAVQYPEQYLSVQFSDPLTIAQDLNGLININNVSNLNFTIEGSEVKVYAPDRLEGNYSVNINEGIENIRNKKINKTVSANINFENRLPAVTIPGKGNIIPVEGKLTFPFEAVNLNAVDVSIIKIYENNIPQFLQSNSLDGSDQLRRVAKPVVQATIRLDQDKAVNLKKKNRFSLDIDKYLKTEPGAIYRVVIGFRKAYSIYKCDIQDAETASENQETEPNYYSEKIDEDDDFWSRYNNYYPYDYSWDERNDPCTNSYYTTDKWAGRNILASNIGLIVKRGNDNSVTVIATDILTTKVLSGVNIRLLDYQNQEITSGTTDGDGMAKFMTKKKPFLLIASKEKQKGYLKLDDGSSLPLGRFKVDGDVVQNGIKGFIYGDRGVWRPGDSLYVSFILEDKENKLPDDLPVIFELYTPQNQLNKKQIKSKGLNGFYAFKVATASTDETGTWQAKVKVGGATFTKSIKIETIMPNRLKIDMDFGAQKALYKDGPGTAKLNVKWLFGAVAQNLKAQVDATLKPGVTRFNNFEQYTFDDPVSNFEPENKVVFDGFLNQAGEASFNTALSSSAIAPGVLNANFLTKVFEPGGNFSIDNISIPYHVYNAYAGIKVPEGDKLSGMLLTNKNHKIELVNVNAKGMPIAGNRNLQVELYKIEWSWWWDQDNDNLSNFTQNKYNQLIKKETVTAVNGKANWNLRIDEPEWGRYLVRVKDLQSGHTTGKTVYIDWPGWAQRELQNNPTEASMLSFTADKEKYNVGEKVNLTIPSSKGGRGLISIESGSKVLKTFWIDTKQGQTKFSFEVEKSMSPNVFINVTLLQPHAQTANDLPIRMYGLIPIIVEDQQTILKPVINMAGVIKPETVNSISVSEQNGKAMTYTIAIVDDGLLDLTRFKTPDPHASFYAREALGVKTWDLFDQVIGAWGGDLERLLSIGGDANINRNVNPAKANRFKPVVKYFGPFYLAKGDKKVHQFKLPQYIGSVRTMVVAADNGAYGFAEKTVEVKKPLMLLATLPRVAGPGETFKVPITVFALDKKVRNVLVSIKTNNILSSASPTQVLNFTSEGEKMLYADVLVKNAIGVGKVKIIAKSGSETAVYDVEFDVRNPNPYITSTTGIDLAPGKTWTSSYKAIGTNGTNSTTFEVSAIPALNLNKRLNYLIQYPYGCVEQTTSSVFPQLYLDRIMSLTPQQTAAKERNIKAGINKLRTFQANDGGLAYWPGQPNAEEWSTNYAGHFMLEAKAAGYTLPIGFLDRWITFQRNKASSWTVNSNNFYGGDLLQSYRLYLLALAKSPEIGAMNRLKEFQYLSVTSKWRLAHAYALIGQKETALKLISGLSKKIPAYKQLSGTFGTEIRDEAMILETLTALGQKSAAAPLMKKIAYQLANDNWYSTQTTAYSLVAIAKYCGSMAKGVKLNYTYKLNNQSKKVLSDAVLQQITAPQLNNAGNYTITNQGNNILFVRQIQQGQAPMGVNPPINNNEDLLNMTVTYRKMDGSVLDPEALTQGTNFIADVSIKNPGKRGYYEQMALAQIFPSGWEIINTRLGDDDSRVLNSSPYTYQNIRDDRVLTYFNIRQGETLTYKVLLNASYLGRYFLPAQTCSAMYDNEIQYTIPGKWITINPLKQP